MTWRRVVAGLGACLLTIGVAVAVIRRATDHPAPRPRAAGVVLAHGIGPLAVALELSRARNDLDVVATLLGPDGKPAHASHVSLRRGGAEQDAQSCGAGCYTATLSGGASAGPLRVRIRDGQRDETGTFVVPRLPAPSAAPILAKATRAWRGLRSLRYAERLASDPAHAINTTFAEQAPNRIEYRIAGGAQGIVIGNSRWDRDSASARWIRSPQTASVRVPSPPWLAPTNVRLLGSAKIGGRPVWLVSFVDRPFCTQT